MGRIFGGAPTLRAGSLGRLKNKVVPGKKIKPKTFPSEERKKKGRSSN